jgi:outer membrane assembly lipoprotein YfiO
MVFLFGLPIFPLLSNTVSDITIPAKKKHNPRLKYRSKAPKRAVSKTYKEMNLDELILAANRMVASQNYESGIKYIERAIGLCDDVYHLAELFILLADLFYKAGDYDKALFAYTEFTKQYPGSERLEYALYQAVSSAWKSTSMPDRDQTMTEKTVELCTDFLRIKRFKEYTEQVKQVKVAAEEKLIQSELNVIQFYIARKFFASAHHRITLFRDVWVSRKSDLEWHIVVQEYNLAVAEKNNESMIEKMNKLVSLDKPRAEIVIQVTQKRTTTMKNRF